VIIPIGFGKTCPQRPFPFELRHCLAAEGLGVGVVVIAPML
jgi:hypothetical protein